MKVKAVIVQNNEKYEGTTWQEVSINGKHKFSVNNLNECPEDAIIGRDLFDANDYIEAVKFGMMLANEGYEDIEEEIVDGD